jgi:hypothetical protein
MEQIRSNGTTLRDRLKKAFGISAPLSNKAISLWAFSFVGFVVSLALWYFGGINWMRYPSAVCFFTALAGCAIASAAQTASQIIRIVEYIRAKLNRETPQTFKEDSPEFTKIVGKAFKFARAKAKNDFRTSRFTANRNNTSVRFNTCQMRNHARAYRSPSRPAFAHVSGSPETDSGQGDSGDSDSGDPPGHQNPVTPPSPLSQPNRKHHPWRSHGSLRLPRNRRFGRRRFA